MNEKITWKESLKYVSKLCICKKYQEKCVMHIAMEKIVMLRKQSAYIKIVFVGKSHKMWMLSSNVNGGSTIA